MIRFKVPHSALRIPHFFLGWEFIDGLFAVAAAGDYPVLMAKSGSTGTMKKLISTRYDGSPVTRQMPLFPEHTEGSGKRPRPKAVGFIIDHVKDENNDGAADIEDVKLFLKRNKANRIALK